MKIEIKLTYDDRTNSVSGRPQFHHRKMIGINADEQPSIDTNYYPEPANLKMLTIGFPFKTEYCTHLVGAIEVGQEQLVSFNKKGYTKIGRRLVNGGLLDLVKRFCNGDSSRKPISEILETDHYIKLECNLQDDDVISITKATFYFVNPDDKRVFSKEPIQVPEN